MNGRQDTSTGSPHHDASRLGAVDWRGRHAPASRRRAQVTSGMIAAVATLTPVVLSVRGTRAR